MYNTMGREMKESTLDWFEELGYQKIFAPVLSPEGEYPERKHYQDVILENRLQDALFRINKGMRTDVLGAVLREIQSLPRQDLITSNKAFHEWIVRGMDVQYRCDDGCVKTERVYLFDFENKNNNDWLVVNQFTVIENHKMKRPDIVVFVNGIPVAVIGLTGWTNDRSSVSEAFNELQTCKKDIPSLFLYNVLLIISDGINARVGTITSYEDRFTVWKTMGDELAPVSVPQLEAVIRGMFEKSRLLDIMKSFVLFRRDGDKTIKIMAGYHQYLAVGKAVDKTIEVSKKQSDGKIGVIWHTQGSGKNFSIVFYVAKTVSILDNPVIIIIPDPNDKDERLYSTFCSAESLLKKVPGKVYSQKQLTELLNAEPEGIIFMQAEHFVEDMGEKIQEITKSNRVIVVAEEANAIRYSLGGNGWLEFGKRIKAALPNASIVGFTGTPVPLADRQIRAVFGDYIDVYDMSRAVEDGRTVRIFYENRMSKIKKDIKLIAQDIVTHFEMKMDAINGKAMIFTVSKQAAIDLYKDIVALRPAWHSSEDNKGRIKTIMAESSLDLKEWQPYTADTVKRNLLEKRLKDYDNELKIVIVNDIWPSEIDVSSMHTLYVMKRMEGHFLMQAITTVNRVFRDKPAGHIVDYVGIIRELNNVLTEYNSNDRKTVAFDMDTTVDFMFEKHDFIRQILQRVDYSRFMSPDNDERIQTVVEVIDFVLGLEEQTQKDFMRYISEIAKVYTFCAALDDVQELKDEIDFLKTVYWSIIKLASEVCQEVVPGTSNQRISESVLFKEWIDVAEVSGLNKDEMELMSNRFLNEITNIRYKNLAVEILKRLLEREYKKVSLKSYHRAKMFNEKLGTIIKKHYSTKTAVPSAVINELIKLAKEINSLSGGQEKTGLTELELPFYEVLANHETAVEVLGTGRLKQIVQEIVKAIQCNTSVDWAIRESDRTRMGNTIARILSKYDFPADNQEYLIRIIIEQAGVLSEEQTYYDGHSCHNDIDFWGKQS